MNDLVAAGWLESIRQAYGLARGTRLSELRGQYVKRFDDRGIHPYSEVCGRITALQALEPALAELGYDPVLLRREAEQDAYDAFVEEVLLTQHGGESATS